MTKALDNLTQEEIDLIKNDQPVRATKVLNDRTKIGLVAAKGVIDKAAKELGKN